MVMPSTPILTVPLPGRGTEQDDHQPPWAGSRCYRPFEGLTQ